jgi:predicted metal-dependent phosphoesterase TrpH
METPAYRGEIDLHTHTYYSDGRASPTELVEYALGLGIKVLAITDHDNARAYREVHPLAVSLGLELIPGLELTCRWDATGSPPYENDIDLLGYYLNVEGGSFHALEQGSLADMRARIDRRCTLLRERTGCKVTLEDVQQQNSRYVGTMALVDTLVAKGCVRDFREGTRLLFAHRDTLPPCALTIDRAIAAIREAGGVAVLAHPSLVHWRGRWLDERAIARLVAMGLGGIEIYHFRLDAAARMHFLALARQYDLAITGGSDEHGWPDGFSRLGTQPVTRAMVTALAERAHAHA